MASYDKEFFKDKIVIIRNENELEQYGKITGHNLKGAIGFPQMGKFRCTYRKGFWNLSKLSEENVKGLKCAGFEEGTIIEMADLL